MGWRAPEADETWGWVTDPTTSDTDGDGWTDSYEIFTKGTNPTSPDTDADGAWDANDRDPLRDLVLEIELKEGLPREPAVVGAHDRAPDLRLV